MPTFLEQEEFFRNRDLTHGRDYLTGLLMREEVLDYVYSLIAKKRPFSYMICDVDNFKFVNDSLGHTIGDSVLRQCADNLEILAGQDGIVGRFGGDEFLIVVPDIVDYDEIWKVCRRIVMGINNLKIEELSGNNISITLGMTRYPLDGETYNDLMEQADKALYRGKQKGRNCFIIYLPEKHAQIQIKDSDAKAFDTMTIHDKIGKILTNSEDLKTNISHLLGFLSSTIMVDHVCVQSETDIKCSSIHPLSVQKEFHYIDSGLLTQYANTNGVGRINHIKMLPDINFLDLYHALEEQKIYGSVFVRIEAFQKVYGYVRADSTYLNGRIWQAEDINLMIMIAKLIGTILHFKKMDLDQIFEEE